MQYIVIDTIDLLLTLSSGNWQLLLYRFYNGSDNIISLIELRIIHALEQTAVHLHWLNG